MPRAGSTVSARIGSAIVGSAGNIASGLRNRVRTGFKSAAAVMLIGPRTLVDLLPSTEPQGRLPLTDKARVAVEAALDETFTAITHVMSAPRQARLLERSRADVLLAAELLADVTPSEFHRRPPAPSLVRVRVDRLARLRYEELTFSSCYEPAAGLPGRDRWLAREPNRTVPVRLLRHDDGPRPWVMCVHGARQGQPTDFSVFRARRLYRRGFNVALPVLPVHDARATSTSAAFPTLDLLDNLHAITQGVSDLRQTLAWIRQQHPTAIAVHGLSLGGHLAAMLVGLEEELDVAIAGVPMSSVTAVLGKHVDRPITGDAEIADYLASEPIRRLDQLMSPFGLAPLLTPERLFIYGGYGDRLSTFAQAEALFQHWGQPAHCWYPGGHVGAVWSGSVQEFVQAALAPLAPDPEGLPLPDQRRVAQ